jgi:hypothetical protein
MVHKCNHLQRKQTFTIQGGQGTYVHLQDKNITGRDNNEMLALLVTRYESS